MPESVYAEIGRSLSSSDRLLLVSHVRPDGDAVGSLLGLGEVLRAAGKRVQMVLEDGVPSSFRHLAGAEDVQRQPDGPFDGIIVLDCSDLARAGAALASRGRPQINVDHHPTNDFFAEINLVVEQACSTTQILFELCKHLGLPVPVEAAAAFLTGLITDTIGFQTSNVTPAALRTAAELADYGLDIGQLYRKGLVEKPFEALKFWAAGLENLSREGSLVWAALSLEARRAAGYPGRDDADLVNQLSTIRGSTVRVVFIEQSDSEVKVSWRSEPGYDVSEIARSFGGGGHRAAAGATVGGSLDEVQSMVLAATRPLLRSDEPVP